MKTKKESLYEELEYHRKTFEKYYSENYAEEIKEYIDSLSESEIDYLNVSSFLFRDINTIKVGRNLPTTIN